jgi:putative transposase
MRKSKFSESQIVGILKEAESRVPVPDVLRTHGVSRGTFFKWRSEYGGASVSAVKRLPELEAENSKRRYADLALENAASKDVLSRTRSGRLRSERRLRFWLATRAWRCHAPVAW